MYEVKTIEEGYLGLFATDTIKKGTVILDYVSNGLSLDPLNIFKKENSIFFTKNGWNCPKLLRNYI